MMILREIEDQPGFTIGRHNFNSIRYTDNIVLMAEMNQKEF